MSRLGRMKMMALLRCCNSVRHHQHMYLRRVISRSSSGTANTQLHTDMIKNGPSLKDFLNKDVNDKTRQPEVIEWKYDTIPYFPDSVLAGRKRSVYFETYGCQMNESDTEIAWAILKNAGYLRTTDLNGADVILVMTCAIRENAETKIWHRLDYLKHLKKQRLKNKSPELKVGILGCMAERLKRKLVEADKMVDLVAGPDSYRTLPQMLAVTEQNQTAVNVLLSLDETYADVSPVRMNPESRTAFVSIMRGCNNMCSYCIVPFTRGKERSRPVSSILDEIQTLSDQGYKEVTLLGQNVNSYQDMSGEDQHAETPELSRGFKTVYRLKTGGEKFADLLDRVAKIDPEMRIRFTSPHPKDFPDDVLHVIKDNPSICRCIHLPAQSGSSDTLGRMNRGYTREAYIALVKNIREILPGVSLTSDFISGFCDESETDHEDTLSLLASVKYSYVYTFAYSMRQKTQAYRHLQDNVPQETKLRRLSEVSAVFRTHAKKSNASKVNSEQLILIEGFSKRSEDMLVGRTEGNIRAVVPNINCWGTEDGSYETISVGDYVTVLITGSTSQTLRGVPIRRTTLQKYHKDEISNS